DEATLERDLPTVIARVRAAGLAPVFVLDELDKLDDPRTRIRLIINRLKHIVTDHGFFCFLTDRNYFDQTEQLIEGGVYPVEHTFFSERLLVLYGSSEFLTFLTDIIAIVPPTAENEEFARLLLSFNIIHHAKRNFADLTREISRLAGEDGKLRVTAEQVLLQPSYRLVAVMQLAVDEILRRPALTGRFESDPGFAQLAVDALYMVSREWEKGSKEVDLSTEKVRRCLNERLAGAAVRVDPKRPRPPPPKVSNADLDVLVEQVHALCGLLSNLESLRAAVRDWSNLPGCANPETVIPESLSGGLLEKAPGSEPVWKFLYDSSGAPRKSSAEMAADDKADERRRLRAFADQASKLVAAAGLSIEDLVAAKVLPKSITWTHVLQAAVDDASAPAATEPAASAPLREFESVFTNRLSGVRDTLLLVRMFRERAGLPLTDAPKVLVRLGRYLNFEAAASPGSAAAPLVPPGLEMPVAPALASPEDMEALTDWLLDSGEADEPVPITPALQTSAWDKWRDRLETHFSATAASWTVTANDLLLAAADRPPSSWLRAPLDQMNIGDWSLLALRCIQESAPTPPWAALAALRALGFGQSLLQRMMGRLLASPALHTWPPADIESSSRLVSTSVDRSAGLLHIAAGPGAVLDSHPGRLPVLGVQLADCEIYRNALDALYDVSAYRALTYEPF
ncbi:MAG: hypothetical protein QOI38_52, partial [Sphingomonadales bacterium]|nr:hypothetical protein [Sphingomonadales bacterium]